MVSLKKISKLLKSNYRKDVKQVIIFFVILIFSSVLLHTGLLLTRYGNLYEEKTKEYNTPDMMYMEVGDTKGIIDNIKPNDYIEEISHYVCVDGSADLQNKAGDKLTDLEVTVFDKEDQKELDDYHLIEESKEQYENGIYLNDYICTRLNLSLGDEITIKIGDMKERQFCVQGIFEGIYLNSFFIGSSSMKVDHKAFVEMSEELDAMKDIDLKENNKTVCTFINFSSNADTYESLGKFTKDIAKYTLEVGGSCWGFTIPEAKDVLLMIPNIAAIVCCAIAILVAMICIVVTSFVIDNNIKRDIKNIGALKAIGYKSWDIRIATIMEFSIVAMVAGVIGIVVSYLLFPKVELIIRPMFGLRCITTFVPETAFITVAFLVLLAVIITIITTRRIVTIKPMIALRFGLESHCFRKNPLPLENRRGNVNVLLAFKTMMQSTGHNIVLALVAFAVSFVMLFCTVLLYNTVVDISAFMRVLNGDTPDIHVTFKDDYESAEKSEDIEKGLYEIPGVRDVNRTNFVYATTEGFTSYIIASDHVENMDCNLCEGVMPVRKNEIVIGTVLAERAEISIGDEVEVSIGDITKKYVVTGLQQSFYGMGVRVYMSKDALNELGQTFEANYFRLKVDNASEKNVQTVIDDINYKYGDEIDEISNQYKINHSSDNLPILAIKYITIVLAGICMIICLLVINLMVKTEIINKQKEYGIKKAIGFTSVQLRFQLAMCMSPVIILGALLGSVSGYIYGNSIITMMCRSFAIQDIGLIKTIQMVPFVAVVVTVYTFVIAFVFSGKIKKISAYQLIVE